MFSWYHAVRSAITEVGNVFGMVGESLATPCSLEDALAAYEQSDKAPGSVHFKAIDGITSFEYEAILWVTDEGNDLAVALVKFKESCMEQSCDMNEYSFHRIKSVLEYWVRERSTPEASLVQSPVAA